MPTPVHEADLEGHVDWVNGLAAAAPGLLASCSSDGTLRLWRSEGPPVCAACLQGHSDYVTALAAAPAAGLLASGGLRGEVRLWDLGAGGAAAAAVAVPPPRPAEGLAGASIYALAADARGALVVAGAASGELLALDARSGRVEARLAGHAGVVRALALAPDGGALLSGGADRTLRLWDLRTRRAAAVLAVHTDSVWALAADADFACVFSGGRDGAVYRTRLATRAADLLAQEAAPVQALALAPGGRALWAATTASTLRCWPVDAAAAASPHGFIAGALPAARARVTFAGGAPAPPPAAAAPLAEIPGAPAARQVAMLTDRRHAVVLDSDGRVALWDACTGARLRDLGETTLADAERALFDPAQCAHAWVAPDARLGAPAGRLAPPGCFGAEAYRRDLGDPAAPADAKANLGEHMLRALFAGWAASVAAAERADAAELIEPDGDAAAAEADAGGAAPMDVEGGDAAPAAPPAAAEPAGPAAAPALDLPPAAWALADPARAVVLVSGGEGQPPWRAPAAALDARRHRAGAEVPAWVADAVLRARLPAAAGGRELKMAFVLGPAEGSGLPALMQARLTAPRVLGVDKVADYLLRRLAEAGAPLREEPLFWAPEKQARWEAEHGGAGGGGASAAADGAPAPARALLITCGGAAVPWDFTLAAARRWMWKRPEDLRLEYGVRGGAPLRPPVIRPPV